MVLAAFKDNLISKLEKFINVCDFTLGWNSALQI